MLDGLYTNSIAEALDIADAHHWTRQPPRSDRARLRFLASQHTDIDTLATHLHTTPAIVQDILELRRTAQGTALHQTIVKEIIRLWQPRVRRRAHNEILNHPQMSMGVHFRAWFGFHGAAGTSDDGRMRHISERLPAPYPARLLQARHREADENELRTIVADAVGEAYFRVSPTGNLHMVRLTNIQYIEFAY